MWLLPSSSFLIIRKTLNLAKDVLNAFQRRSARRVKELEILSLLEHLKELRNFAWKSDSEEVLFKFLKIMLFPWKNPSLQIFEDLSCKRGVKFILCGSEVEVGPADGSSHKVCSVICWPLVWML